MNEKGKREKFVKVVDLMSLSYSFKEREREREIERESKNASAKTRNTGQEYWESYSFPSFPCVKVLSMFIVQETAVMRVKM